MGRLALEHFFEQVIQDEGMAAGEGGDEAFTVRAILERDGSQLQPGGPAFRAGCQGGGFFWREREMHHLTEEQAGLFGSEAQVGLAQLEQLAASAQARQG